MLALVGAIFRDAGALVSFNGKSFDAPVLETRYLFHRLGGRSAQLPHVDMLHPARQFWQRDGDGRTGDGESGCSLVRARRACARRPRAGDVPGFEIPARYFQFMRTGDARPLAAVLEHNRLDLLSLAGLERTTAAPGRRWGRAGAAMPAKRWRLAVSTCAAGSGHPQACERAFECERCRVRCRWQSSVLRFG